MDQKSVALQLRKLAADPDNQTFIVKEEQCMKGLVAFLDSDNDDVVVISLQALHFLSSHPDNLEPLSAYPGLLIKLTNLTEHNDRNIKRFATDTLTNLTGFINGEEEGNQSFKPRTVQEVQLTILEMTSEQDRVGVERTLVGVAGVTSVTIQRLNRKVTIYTSKAPELFAPVAIKALQRAGFTATVSEKQGNEENQAPASSAPGYLSNTGANAKAPSYATPVKPAAAPGGPGYLNAPPKPAGPGYLNTPQASNKPAQSIVRYTGLGQTSLSARFAQKEKEKAEAKKKQDETKSVFGRVTSFFW